MSTDYRVKVRMKNYKDEEKELCFYYNAIREVIDDLNLKLVEKSDSGIETYELHKSDLLSLRESLVAKQSDEQKSCDECMCKIEHCKSVEIYEEISQELSDAKGMIKYYQDMIDYVNELIHDIEFVYQDILECYDANDVKVTLEVYY